jgi:poly [ADP-ribose] polymerase 7/11/12/13
MVPPRRVSVARQGIPSYWLHKHDHGDDVFDQMVYVEADKFSIFDKLLKASYQERVTQDRPCPKATCAKKPGGCPCVQKDGDPGLPKEFIVRRVIRVEDSVIWKRYTDKLEEIQGKRKGESLDSFNPPLLIDATITAHPEVFAPLDKNVNEVYTFHGTHVRNALCIGQNDFKVDLAGSNRGTMYGKGAYFAESCMKADEYARDEAAGFYEGIFAMLICRMCMGKFFYTEDRDEKAIANWESGTCDSTFGDRAKKFGTFRELAIYNADQVYPEYIVLYSRLHKKDDAATLRKAAAVPFHMQLPVYWTNCHLDPFNAEFAHKYAVRKVTWQVLQKLIDESCKSKHTIVDAWRIENSKMWTQYVNFKRSVQKRDQHCIPPNKLDGDESSGHVLTSKIMKSYNAESAISLTNIDDTINEFLMWHGTSSSAASSIAESGFRIPVGSGAHGARFGHGSYFAESLDKSLSYAKSEDGFQHILLCRVCCGQFYYTEKGSENDAHTSAANSGKDSVLAYPSRSDAREFIVHQECQVYPEFQMRVNNG